MNERGDVTTVIPACVRSKDGAALFERTITSVAEQTVPPGEVLLIDDGSTEPLHRPHDAAFPIHVVELPNRGPLAARNVGIQLATTEFVHVLDHDDHLSPRFYEAILSAYASHPEASLVHGLALYVDPVGNPTGARIPPSTPNYRFWRNTLFELIRLNCVHSVATVFRRSLYQTLGGFRRYELVCDWDFCLRAATERAVFRYEPNAVAYHTRHAGQLTSSERQQELIIEDIEMLSDAQLPLWAEPLRRYKMRRKRIWLRHLESLAQQADAMQHLEDASHG